MAERRTRVVLSIPWDDEDTDHPGGWDYDTMLAYESARPLIVVDFEDVDEKGQPIPAS